MRTIFHAMTTLRLTFALAIVIASNFAVQAQTQTPAPSAKAADAATSTPTAAAVQDSLKALEAAGTLPEESKTKARDAYKQALERLQARDNWDKRADQYETDVAAVPGLLVAARAELTSATAEPAGDITATGTLVQLEQALAETETALQQARDKIAQLDGEPKRRADRRVEITKLISSLRDRQVENKAQLSSVSAAGDPVEVAASRISLVAATAAETDSELDAIQKELRKYEAEGDLLTAQRDLAARKVSQLEAQTASIQKAVADQRRREAQAAVEKARQARADLVNSQPELKRAASENEALASERLGRNGLSSRIEEVQRELSSVTAALSRLQESFKSVTDRINAVGLTHATGLLLSRYQAELPGYVRKESGSVGNTDRISDIQLRLIELEDMRSELKNLDAATAKYVATSAVRGQERDELTSGIRDLLRDRRAILDSLIADYNRYFTKLVDLDSEQQRLVVEARKFDDYISERVLWVKNVPPISIADFRRMTEALMTIANPQNWIPDAIRTGREIAGNSTAAAGLVGIILVCLIYPRFRARIRDLGRTGPEAPPDSFRHTLESFVFTALAACRLPLIFAYVGWVMTLPGDASENAKSLANGFFHVALALTTLEWVRIMVSRQGVVEAHFGWNVESLAFFRRRLMWMFFVAIPCAFLIGVAQSSDVGIYDSMDSLCRIALAILLLNTSLFVFLVLRPGGRVMKPFFLARPRSFETVILRLTYLLFLVTPTVLAVASCLGYQGTAMDLRWRLAKSLWIIMAAVIGYSLGIRALRLAWRRLAWRLSTAHFENLLGGHLIFGHAAPTAKSGVEGAQPPVEPEIDLQAIDRQSSLMLKIIAGAALAVALWWVWSDVLPALNVMNRVTLWSHTMKVTETVTSADGTETQRLVERVTRVTLSSLLFALLIAGVTIAAARNLPAMLEVAVLQRLPLERGNRYIITTVARYAITLAGLGLAFGAIGIGWADVQWIAAAATVGLAFGLQEIVANFVSGLIILFERPIRVGDTVTVSGVTGVVSRIRIRATTITNWERQDFIVPNKKIITGEVLNWTLQDTVLRQEYKVSVDLGSDATRVRDILLEIAKSNRYVLNEPPPHALFDNISQGSMNFILRLFLPNSDNGVAVRHEINASIVARLEKEGIRISRPPEELRLIERPAPDEEKVE
ncbi:MAG: mechanosensitive ion channel [Candidatus Sumerlaeaceae bacterium]|nr:mechanosensitive ion channel [Candidatus Sumerlaeaceae bacterium]